MAFRTLPILLISFVAFLAIGLGNMGMFVLLLGQAVLVPLVTTLVQLITGVYPSSFQDGSDVTSLVASMSNRQPVNVTPSYWMQHVLFFFGYLVANGVGLYLLPQEKGQSDMYYENRRAKARGVIIVSVLAAVLFSFFRYKTGAETVRGMAVALVTGGGLGYAWYQFAAYCGARHADVFGVAPTLLPATAKEEKAMTCVYAPKP